MDILSASVKQPVFRFYNARHFNYKFSTNFYKKLYFFFLDRNHNRLFRNADNNYMHIIFPNYG